MTNYLAGERALLEAMLDVQRTEIAELLDGLGEQEARLRLVPSLTTPLGLVKHATFVEKVWFHSRIAGVPRAELGLPDDVDESYAVEPGGHRRVRASKLRDDLRALTTDRRDRVPR